MRSLRCLLLILAACSAAAGCGRKGRAAAHGTVTAVPAAAPTPDTTPVEVLRTPAGLVLKTDTTPLPATPSPAATPRAAS